MDRLVCQWCQSQNQADAVNCRNCGAPLNIAFKVTESGWTAAPQLRDLTEIHFGSSVCQVDGHVVPVVEVAVSAEDSVIFEHHTLLWKEPATKLSCLSLQGMMKRVLSGMPVVVTVAQGPGRVAFSRDNSGQVVVLPMHPGQELDVREHAFLLASQHIDYSYTRIKGLTNILFGGQGMFMDRFVTKQDTGLLILHGYGNVFQRTLAQGETMLVEPGGFLYKDSSVELQTEMQQLSTGFFGGTGMSLMKLTGPGRVGIQSMYHHHASE